MLRVAFALLAWVLLSAQTPMLPGFPPGTFQNRAALDTAPLAGYTGPADLVSGASHAYGLQAATSAWAAAQGNLADLRGSSSPFTAVCTLKSKTNGYPDLTTTYCGGTTVPLACAAATGGSCSIHKLYDQIGSLDAAAGPVDAVFNLSPSGTIIAGLPVISGTTGVTDGYVFTLSATVNQPYTISVLGRRTGNFTTEMYWGGTIAGVGVGLWGTRNQANQAVVYYGGSGQFAAATDSTWHSWAYVGAGASSDLNIDGTQTTVSPGTNSISGGIGIMVGFNQGGAMTGDMIMWIMYPTKAFSPSESSNLSTAQHTYCGC